MKPFQMEALDGALRQAVVDYVSRNPSSARAHSRACQVIPGGNTRTSLFCEPFPLSMLRGDGAYLWDLDDHEYIDLLGNHTAGLFGHSHPIIRGAVERFLTVGVGLGAQTALETELALAICHRFPSIELVRFTSSGTEANLMALCAARVVTKRSKVLVFQGAYHGGVLSFAPSGGPVNAPFDFVVAEYNNASATEQLIHANRDVLAAVLVEPMLGSAGCIPADRAFLDAVRRATSECGAWLIFDEVMTSRLSPGGLQECLGLIPDITTLGKYIGGGFACGAFGGRAALMRHFDARLPGSLPHSGTFNNSVPAMIAGAAGLALYSGDFVAHHNSRGDRLRTELNQLAERFGASLQFTGIGSMLNLHVQSRPIRSPSDSAQANPKLRTLLLMDLLEEGLWLGARGLMALSLPLTEVDYARVLGTFSRVIERRLNLLKPE